MPRPTWTSERLAKLQTDYEENVVQLDKLAQKYQTSMARISQMSRDMGWMPRAIGSKTTNIEDRLDALLARRQDLLGRHKALSQELHYLDRRIFAVRATQGAREPDLAREPETEHEINPTVDGGNVKP